MILGDDNSRRKATKTRQYGVLCLIIFLFMLSLFIWVPALAEYLIQVACDDVNGGVDCESAEVSKRGGFLYQTLLTTNTGVSLCTNGGLCVYSDRVGRRPVLIFCLLMGLPLFIAPALVMQFGWNGASQARFGHSHASQ
jgi:MFS family permease